MADKKLSQETAASALDGTEYLRGTQAGADVKITADQVATYAVATAANAEKIRDTIGTALVAGSGITISVNDAGDTITIGGSSGTSTLDAYALSASASLTSSQFYKHVQADATSGAVVITLPASASNEGDWIFARKIDTSTNMVTVEKSDGTDLAWLNNQNDWALAVWRSSAWVIERWGIKPFREVVTATGTTAKTIPPLCVALEYGIFGAGAGGGAGRRGAAGTARYGGGGGAPGAYVEGRLPYATISGASTISAIVGTGGAGESGITVDDTSGSGGTNGGQSEIRTGATTLARAGSAIKGGGGSATAGTGGSTSTAGTQQTYGTYAAGASSSIAATPSTPNAGVCGPGGAGGGLDTSNNARAGGSGAQGSVMINSTSGAAGSGGSAGSGGGNGSDITDTNYHLGGGGGGGGGASAAAAGGAGGNGGAPGGGGGGGGASVNGQTSGGGGTGGRGEVRLRWHFH